MPNVLSTLLTVHECTCAEVGHTWHPSCLSAAAEIFLDVLRVCPGIYPPLYLIAMILRGKGLDHLPRLAVDSLRSSLFLALNGFGFVSFFCMVTKLSGGLHILGSFIPGFFGGFLAVLAERKSRRSVLALYVLQMAADFVYHQLEFRGIVSGLPKGEVYLFSAFTAVLMYLYRHKETSRQGFMGSILRFLLWESRSVTPSEDRPSSSSSQQSLYRQSVEHLKLCYRRSAAAVCARLPRHPAALPLFNSFEVGARGFMLGYGLQTALAFLSNLRSIFKKPGVLLRVFANKSSAMFGLFVGGFVGIYKALLVLLKELRGKDDGINTAIAGGVGGLSMFCFPSASLATNLGSKVVEMIYLELHRAGHLPSYYYFDCLLYALSFGVLTHGANVEPHNLRRSYYRFLLYITAGKWGDVDHHFMEVFGTQASLLKRTNNMPSIR